MPHLSPVIWTSLYGLVWFSFILLVLSFEFMSPSLFR